MNKYFKDLEYKLIDKRTAYRGKRIVVEELTYLNGNQKIHREHVLAGDAAVMLAITEENDVIMIQEPRTPIKKVILGLPAGMIEPGEKPEDGARRELQEETGYIAKDLTLMRVIYPTVGYSNERTFIYLAKNLEKAERHLDETEDIDVIKIPLSEIKEMLDKNEIITASTTIALMNYFMYNAK